ncbi:hypothetical protein WV31_09780 [Magnetospirillum sp. ME-1]|uniref:hypothetical protein n=1 Tax=Magnetospirillum sp. ME-1 TaxID=1639348 RepID=UPI000A17A047|nr:hypothetical protein [Magnetospirillum sp. ME-1]ARJ65924.1 hypothetical protein WV31_09780 [Magnetospirillum sp. ME-1]
MRSGFTAIGLIAGILWSASSLAAETRQLGGGYTLHPVSGALLEIRKDGKRLWSCIPRDGDRDETECTLARPLPGIAKGAVLIQSADTRGRVPNTCTLVVPGKGLDIHAYPSWLACADTVMDVDGDGIPEFLTPSTFVPRSVGAEDDYPFAAFASLVPLDYGPDTGLRPKLASLRRPVVAVVAEICRFSRLTCTDARGLTASWDGPPGTLRYGVPLPLWRLAIALVESGNGAEVRKVMAAAWLGEPASLECFLHKVGGMFMAGNDYAEDFLALNGGKVEALGLEKRL